MGLTNNITWWPAIRGLKRVIWFKVVVIRTPNLQGNSTPVKIPFNTQCMDMYYELILYVERTRKAHIV